MTEAANKAAGKAPQGFALLSPERRREIASLGGKRAQESGRGHQFTSKEAREAGRKGAAARLRNQKAKP